MCIRDSPYFDGNTPDTTEFDFEWLGTPNSSASRRINRPSEGFVILDPDCAVVPSAPRPPQIVNDCVVVIGEWLRYQFPIAASHVSEWLAIIPTIFLSTLGAPATQVRIRFFPNPDGLPVTQFDGWDSWDGELYLSYMPANARVTLDGITRRAYADVPGHENVSMDHLLYGSNGGVVSWPLLSCGSDYIMTIDTPLDLSLIHI